MFVVSVFYNELWWETELLILIALVVQVGFNAIAEALGLAAVKAVVAITGIIAGGRLVRIVVLVQMK
jgi:hypothetical protein